MKVNSFDNKYIIKYPITFTDSIAKINKLNFSKYSEDSSPIRWVFKNPIYRNLNIISLDFFKNYETYNIIINKIDDLKNAIYFKSEDYFVGKIIYNSKNFMPIEIEYYNQIPYEYFHSSSRNLKSTFDFESVWLYKKQINKISFSLSNIGLYLSEIEIYEIIKDFNFKKFDKKGNLIYEEKNNFETLIKIKNEN